MPEYSMRTADVMDFVYMVWEYPLCTLVFVIIVKGKSIFFLELIFMSFSSLFLSVLLSLFRYFNLSLKLSFLLPSKILSWWKRFFSFECSFFFLYFLLLLICITVPPSYMHSLLKLWHWALSSNLRTICIYCLLLQRIYLLDQMEILDELHLFVHFLLAKNTLVKL